MDRRRTYVDIMERVLGPELLVVRPRQQGRFVTEVNTSGAPVGTAISAVEVRMLDSIDIIVTDKKD